jgi:hypothetical protein
MLPVSLDCTFFVAVCVPHVASLSGLYILGCRFGDISWTNTTEFTSLLDRIKAVDTNPRMMTILSNEVCEYKYCFEIYKVD